MGGYFLKRVFLFIPTLLVISLLTFLLSQNTPGDPVALMLNRPDSGGSFSEKTRSEEKDYKEMRSKMGLDLPVFYFSLSDLSQSDTLYKVPDPNHRNMLKRLSALYGNWPKTSSYYHSIIELKSKILDTNSNEKGIRSAITDINLLTYSGDSKKIKASLDRLEKSHINAVDQANKAKHAFTQLEQNRSGFSRYIPIIHWHGLQNQYHRWISGFLTGDFGISYKEKLPVSALVYGAVIKTLVISILSILLSYLIAIPLGVHSAIHRGSTSEKVISTSLFALYSLPNFWIATLLVTFFCGGDYFDWFPSPGSPSLNQEAPMWMQAGDGIYRMILPLVCWTYGSLAFISRQTRGGILESIKEDYIRTARAKGVDEKRVVMKHAFRNSLLPIITLFAGIFPLAISGSFVIETIFNIHGMGKLTIDALYARDYPVIFTLMLFTAILTMLGNLIADLFYALSDPRISYAGNASN